MENRKRRRVRVRDRYPGGMKTYGHSDDAPNWGLIALVAGGLALVGLFVAALRA